MSQQTTRVGCVIPNCPGRIIKSTTEPANTIESGRVTGPHGKMPAGKTELYCSYCGVEYHHLPKSIHSQD